MCIVSVSEFVIVCHLSNNVLGQVNGQHRGSGHAQDETTARQLAAGNCLKGLGWNGCKKSSCHHPVKCANGT